MSTQTSTSGKPLRTLVTGGAGFIGSHLCDRLLAEGHHVVCLDSLVTGRVENIQHLLSHCCFTFVQHDITCPIDLPHLLGHAKPGTDWSPDNCRPDLIFHLASPASPRDYAQHPIHTLKVGALGTYHVLGLAKAQGSSFLISSTSEVYGDPEMSPQPETYWGRMNPVGPRSVYDEAKRFAEAITMAYWRQHQVKVRIARIFNTYGERMRSDDGRVLPNFICQALQNKPLTVYGDGSQTRSLCYVGDMVEGLYRLMMSAEVGPLNLGNPCEITILELAEKIIKTVGSRSTIVFEPLPEDDPRRLLPDIRLAQTRLGWTPCVALEEGLPRTIACFEALLRQNSAAL